MRRFVPRAAAALLMAAASVAAECAPVDVMLEERLVDAEEPPELNPDEDALAHLPLFELATGYVVMPAPTPIRVAQCARSPADPDDPGSTTIVTVRCDEEGETHIEASEIEGPPLPAESYPNMDLAVPWEVQPPRFVFNAGWPLNPDHTGDGRDLPELRREYQLAKCFGSFPGVVGDALLHRKGVVEARLTVRRSPAPTTAKYGVDNKMDPAAVASDSMVEAYFAGRALKELRSKVV